MHLREDEDEEDGALSEGRKFFLNPNPQTLFSSVGAGRSGFQVVHLGLNIAMLGLGVEVLGLRCEAGSL